MSTLSYELSTAVASILRRELLPALLQAACVLLAMAAFVYGGSRPVQIVGFVIAVVLAAGLDHPRIRLAFRRSFRHDAKN